MSQHLAYIIASVNRQLEEELQERLRPAACRSSSSASRGARRRGPLPMGELAGRALVEPPTLTKIIDRMVSESLVFRTPDPSDGAASSSSSGMPARLSTSGCATSRPPGTAAHQAASARQIEELRLSCGSDRFLTDAPLQIEARRTHRLTDMRITLASSIAANGSCSRF